MTLTRPTTSLSSSSQLAGLTSGALPRSDDGSRIAAQLAWAVSKFIWAPLDACVAGTAVVAAYAVAPHTWDPVLSERLGMAAAVQAALVVSLHFMSGSYDRSLIRSPRKLLARVLVVSALATVTTVGLFYVLYFEAIGRWVAGLIFVFSALGSLTPRNLLSAAIRRRPRRTVFLGDSAPVRETMVALRERFSTLYEVVDLRMTDGPLVMPLGGDIEPLAVLCRDLGIDEIVLSTTGRATDQDLGAALACASYGCHIRTAADFYEELFRRVPLSSEITLGWLFAFGWDSTNHFRAAVKRVTDVLLAVVVFVCTLPVWVVVPLLIKIFDSGPVLYRQTRVGHHSRPFRILKFRTMIVDSDRESTWTLSDDPRATSLGRWLRRYRLDEIPQLLNIIRGEMSFVGPRPERPEITRQLEQELPYYAFRHLVRPGLTGWAQVNYGYGASVEDARVKLEYDLYYVRHASLSTDLAIVLRTMTSFAKGGR